MRRFQKFFVGFVLAVGLLGGAMPTQAQTTARATTTIGVVTIRQIISGSLSFASGTTVKLADGSASLPSLTFASDTDNGLFTAASNSFGITAGGSNIALFSSTEFRLASNAQIGWNATVNGAYSTVADVVLVRDAANTLAQRNGTSAQRFNIANTWTSAISNEYFSADWQTIANTVIVGMRTAATGTARDMVLTAQDTNGSSSASSILLTRSAAPFVHIGPAGISSTAYDPINASNATGNGFVAFLDALTSTATNGSTVGVKIVPTYNQSGSTTANTDLLVNRTETLIGSGAQLLLDLQVGGSSKFKVDRTGAVTQSAGIKMGPSASLEFNTKGLLNGGVTDGLFSLTNDGSGFGPQVNAGTAAPTVTTCGTGSVTAHSSNTAGEITATGATTCTVTFGAPNWTNTPFCIVEDETSAVAQRISAISISAFTVTALTSGDKFMYHCFGGI